MKDSAAPMLSARDLILTLIDSANRWTLSAKYFVAAGALYGIDQSSMRVALGRLVKDGSLEQAGRGAYKLGSRGGTLHRLVRNWSKVESSVKPWKGGWTGVFTANLKRSDRASLRSRERALKLFGFAEPETGLWVRPDNLTLGSSDLRAALLELGLESEALTYQIAAFTPADSIRFDLWPIKDLERRYRDNLVALSDSTTRLAQASEEELGRETLLLGRAVTRDILLDPLLPPEMIDVSLRKEVVQAMRAYDKMGKQFWRNFEATHNQRSD